VTVRLLATSAAGRIVVVGASLDDNIDTLRELLAQLLVGGPVALGLASVAGYVLAGAALRPVEVMRRGAATISTSTSGRRLPLPPANDEIRRLATTLNQMLDRLDAGLRRERQFVADASHELRTPLALLRTEIELALRRRRTHEELHSALRSASHDVDRLVELAEDLLALASTDDGTVPLRTTRFPLRDLLDDVAGRFAARAHTEGRQIGVGTAPEIDLDADRLRLELAVGNLVDNALRHGAGTVQLSAETADGQVVLHVRDEGTGFPDGFHAEAFERFSRGDPARTTAGAGLGLAIVAAIARAHRGNARAHNRSGGGAAVTITIPATPEKP
jgi:two-component system OmpR family sensor kinase